MKQPNIWISWVLGIAFSIVSLGAYIGTAFLEGWAGLISRLAVIVIVFGIIVGSILHITRKLNWITGEDEQQNK